MQLAILTLVCTWLQLVLASVNSPARLAELELADISDNVLASGVLNNTVVFGYTFAARSNAQNIPWDSLTHLVLAFLRVDPAGTVSSSNSSNVQELVSTAHANGVKVVGSIGGDGDGSRILATVLSTNMTRVALAASLVGAIKTYQLDGVDYDFEFPENTQQLGHLLAGLQTMRADLDAEFGRGAKLLTMTLFSRGLFGPSVAQTDAKPFSDLVDYGLLMSYDFFGSFSETSAPNSPFYDIPGHPGLSFTSSISAWLKSGWNPTKLVAGLPFYGRTAIVDVSSPPTSQFMPNTGSAPPGGPADKIPGAWTWNDLRDPENGALSAPATPREGWQRFWDPSTETPWLLHNVSRTYIGFDDPESLAIKAHYIITQGLVGAMVWMVQYDFDSELGTVLGTYAAACSRISKLAADTASSKINLDSIHDKNSLDGGDHADGEDMSADGGEAMATSTAHKTCLTRVIRIAILAVLLQCWYCFQ
ncbi:hypothetical protein IWW50_004936 [Coemansia erecta]|nr:hypothetical protein IWW50_004936 [Coemansia erecta]